MNLTLEQISQYVDQGFIALFVLLLSSVFVSALIGFKKGIWKATYRMIFMFSLILIAFLTLSTFTEFLGNLDISQFFKGELFITRKIGEDVYTYYIPLTSVRGTITETIRGFYVLYNVSTTDISATRFAIAIVDSVLKLIFFLLAIILIVTLGNLFSFILWHLIFKRFVPKAAQKLVKLRWVAAIEHAVTYLALVILFFSPITSILNSVNQSYQRNKPTTQDQMTTTIGGFIDAYNSSLFAQVFFNWTVDESGMTFDTRLIDTFTTGISEDVSFSFIKEFSAMTDLIMVGINGITFNENQEIVADFASFLTKDVINSIFDGLEKSQIINTLIPLVADIALNSDLVDDLLQGAIPPGLLDLSDIEFKNEISNLRNMVNSLFDSGLIDELFVENEQGKLTLRSLETNADAVAFINDVVYSENFTEILNVFKHIDDSKLLTRAIPALLSVFLEGEQGSEIKQYLPVSWDQLNEISWGYECYVLFDFLHGVAMLDQDFLNAIFVQTGMLSDPEAIYPTFTQLISDYADDFIELLVGKVEHGELVNVDRFGHTIVFDNQGNRIAGRRYNLFDMNLINMALPQLTNDLFELDVLKSITANLSPSDLNAFKQAVASLNNGNRIINYKVEFAAILDIVATLAKDKVLLDALLSEEGFNSLMLTEGDYFSIDVMHIDYFQQAIQKMDNSNLLYNALMPIIKSTLLGSDISKMLSDYGLRTDVIASAIDHDMAKAKNQRSFFTDLSSVLDKWEDLQVLSSFTSITDSNGFMDVLKDETKVDSLISILNVIHENPIINPTPQVGDNYAKNENLYGLLGYVFDMIADVGLVVPRSTLEKVETVHTWNDEFDAFGNIIKYIAARDVLNAGSMFENGLTQSAISNLKDDGEGKINLPGFLEKIDDSYIFSQRLGPFLDELLGDALSGFLIDYVNNVSFSNVTNWTKEAANIRNLLNTLYDLTPEDDEEAANFLANFDIASFTKVVELNKMLHELANSGIFYYVDEHNNIQYNFGKWLYAKIAEAMGSFNVGDSTFDLLADPTPKIDNNWDWKTSWGVRPGDGGVPDSYFLAWKNQYYDPLKQTHYIAYRDFVSPEGIDANDYKNIAAFWCNYDQFIVQHDNYLSVFGNKITSSTSNYYDSTNKWDGYFASANFIADYDSMNLFDVDEISRVVRFMTYAMRLLVKDSNGQSLSFESLETELIDGLLTAVNETTCMRMAIYNLYSIVGEEFLTGDSAFKLDTANNIYMVDAGLDMQNFEQAREERQRELNLLIDFYNVIDKLKNTGILDGANIDFGQMINDGVVDDLKRVLTGFNNSYVFHRAGPSKTDELTPFQQLFDSLLGKSEMKNVIYLGNESPKDSIASEYTTAEEKVTYLVKSTFKTDLDFTPAQEAEKEASFIEQNKEIASLMDVIKKVYSLVDNDGNKVTDISQADFNKSENIAVVDDLLKTLVNSDLFYDCVPNMLYNVLVKNNQLNFNSGGLTINFAQVDPFYHYFFNGGVYRATPDYEAKYSESDISSITDLLYVVADLTSDLSGDASFTDPNVIHTMVAPDGVISSLLTAMHDLPLFHSPARNHPNPGNYYTSVTNANEHTLFESTIAQVLSLVGMDEFAYDTNYADDVSVYGSAENKLNQKIKLITRADDDNLLLEDEAPYYHHNPGIAWTSNSNTGEIHAIMNLISSAADIGMSKGESSLDLNSFGFDTISPDDVKTLLLSINMSDIIADAIPRFLKQGLGAIGIDALTEYNGTSYANYRLGQALYGGEAFGDEDKGEIGVLTNTLRDLYDGVQYNQDIASFTNLSQGDNTAAEKNLRAILRFVYYSRILNTNLDGDFGEFNVVEGRQISAQGIFLYHAVGDVLGTYIGKDADPNTSALADIDKIALLSKIAHLVESDDTTDYKDTPAIEAKALVNIFAEVNGGLISNDTFDEGGGTNTIDIVKNLEDTILGVVENAYNVEGAVDPNEYRRSYIVSEFVSGFLNTILENQYSHIENDLLNDNVTRKYGGYQYVTFSFGEDDPTQLSFESYDKLNAIERRGLKGLLDSLNYLSELASPVPNFTAINSLVACFEDMGATPETNSELARVLYLTEAHASFKALDAGSHDPFNPLYYINPDHFDAVDETTIDPNHNNNIYSNVFSFASYGERIATFFNI